MTPTLSPEDERRFQDALPAFLAGQLTGPEQAWMQQQRQQHPALDAEARTLEQLRSALRDEAAREDTGPAWQRLQQQLHPAASAPARGPDKGPARASRWADLRAFLRATLGARPALALASLVIVVQAGAIGWLLQSQRGAEDEPAWRSLGPASLQEAPRAQLLLQLAPGAPVQALAPLLAPQAGGPRAFSLGADGRWRLSLPADEADAALAAAQGLPAVQQARLLRPAAPPVPQP